MVDRTGVTEPDSKKGRISLGKGCLEGGLDRVWKEWVGFEEMEKEKVCRRSMNQSTKLETKMGM